MPLPITIIGGYLGAGKTTLVNHLLRNANGVRLAILVNEFGALPIDQDLIEAQDDDIIAIAGGCVCCSYGNDLTMALIDLQKLDPAPDHVLLEASGVALPGAIAASTSLLSGYGLDGIVVVANAETIREQALDTYIGDTITRQLDDADLVVLNKTDLIMEDQFYSLKDWVKGAAPNAETVPTTHGKVPSAVVLQSYIGREHSAHQHNHVADHFTTLNLAVDAAVDVEKLAAALADEASGLVRAKGFVTAAGGTHKTIQIVGRRWTVTDAPEGVVRGLVAIGPTNSVNPDFLNDIIVQCQIDE